MATDNILRDIIRRQQNVSRAFGNPSENIDAARLIAELVGGPRNLSETLTNQRTNIGFSNAREFREAAEESRRNRNRAGPVGTELNPLQAAMNEARESRAAVQGAGGGIPGMGILALGGNIVKGLAEQGLENVSWTARQLARVDDSIKSGLAGSLNAIKEGEPFWRTLDDYQAATWHNFLDPGSVPGSSGGELVQSIRDVVPGLQGAKDFADRLVPGTPGDVKWGSPSTYLNLLHPERIGDVALGAGLEVGLSPSSYLSLGATSVVEPGSKAALSLTTKSAADEVAQLAHLPKAAQNAVRQAGTRKGSDLIAKEMQVVQSGVRRGVKKLSQKVVDAKVGQQLDYAVEQVSKEGDNWVNQYRKWLKAGKKGPKPKNNPAYQAIHDAAKQSADTIAFNMGSPVSATQLELLFQQELKKGLQEFARGFVPEMDAAIRRVWDPLLRRKINPRVGFLGRGADLGSGRIASRFDDALGNNPIKNFFDPVLEAAYKPFGALGKVTGGNEVGRAVLRNFSTGEHFPGFANKIRQTTKASGVRDFENAISGKHGPLPVFRDPATNTVKQLKSFKEIFSGVDNDIADEIYTALEEGRVMTGATRTGRALAEVQQDVKDWLEYVKQERINTGMQEVGETVDEFLPVKHKRAWKKETREQARKFKQERKLEAHDTNSIIKHNATNAAQNAAYSGLKFERDIRDVMADYLAKHQRDLVRLNWQTEMLNRFGVANSGLNPALAREMGLVTVGSEHLPRALKGTGLTHYMNKDMYQTMKSWEELWSRSSSGLDEVQSLTNAAEQASRAWKISATLARPSFQLRNFLGDISTGWLDGVPNHKYARFANALRKGPTATLFSEGGRDYSLQYLDDIYMRNAGSSSYFNTGALSGGTGKGFVNKFVDFNEARENLPRRVHFTTAFEDEMRSSVKKWRSSHGGANPSATTLREMEKKAEQAAVARVNKFKFDYSNLTPFEAQWLRNVIPFYTFQKKATQMVLENAILSPGRMNAANRTMAAIQGELSGDPNEAWQYMYENTIPPYAKDLGFLPLSPLGDTGDVFGLQTGILPQTALNTNFAGQSNSDIARNLVGQFNPILRFLPEMALEQDLGTGIPRQASLKGLISYVPPATTLGKGLDIAGWEEGADWLGTNVEKGTGQSVGEFVGLPIQNITEEQRVYAQKNASDAYGVEVSKINRKLEASGIEVKTITKNVDGKRTKVYRVQSAEVDPETGRHEVYMESDDRAGAYSFAMQAIS